MKQLRQLIFAATVTSLFTFSQCKKNNTEEEPQLPPETTTGANNFGCKVNGKVFVPKDGRGKPGLYCQYVNLGSGAGGGWHLNIPAVDWVPSSIPAISITTDSLLVQEGQTYQFKSIKGNAKASYQIESYYFVKTDTDLGEIKITKFDNVNRILSGTFFFSGTDATTNQKVTITEGRFDVRY